MEEVNQFHRSPHFARIVAEILMLFVFFGLLVLTVRSCAISGVVVTTGEVQDELKEAENQYSEYAFRLVPAAVGTHDDKYIVLCRVNGEWVKVGSGFTEELLEEKKD